MSSPIKTYQKEENSEGKKIQVNASTGLIWDFFFSMEISLFAYIGTFSGQSFFGGATSSVRVRAA